MQSSIEEEERSFTSSFISLLSLYSALLLQLSVLAALAAAGFFAAATQVWQYPVPRIDFSVISIGLLVGAIAAYASHWAAEGAIKFLQNGYTILGLLLFVTALSVCSPLVKKATEFPIGERLKCVFEDLAVCVQEHSK